MLDVRRSWCHLRPELGGASASLRGDCSCRCLFREEYLPRCERGERKDACPLVGAGTFDALPNWPSGMGGTLMGSTPACWRGSWQLARRAEVGRSHRRAERWSWKLARRAEFGAGPLFSFRGEASLFLLEYLLRCERGDRKDPEPPLLRAAREMGGTLMGSTPALCGNSRVGIPRPEEGAEPLLSFRGDPS